MHTNLVNSRPSRGAGHVIDEYRVQRDYIRCKCGAETTVDGFVDHRRAQGLPGGKKWK